MEEYPFIRQLWPPITEEQLLPLDARCRVVQWCEPLSDPDLKKVAEFMGSYPSVTLRVYGHYSKPFDLEFLRFFGFVRNFQVDVFDLKDFSGLSYLNRDIEYLGLGQTRSKNHTLRILERFRSLRKLYIEGHLKDIDAIGELTNLEDLTLRSVTLPNLSILKPLTRLLSFDLKLGGTSDLRLLPEIGRLRYLELWMVRGLSELGCIADIHSLQYLFLQALKGVTSLPSLRALPILRRVHIETMKGLNDFRPVADAPILEELLLVDMRHIQPEALRPFIGHPRLKHAVIGLGSLKKNEAARKLLSLPPVISMKDGFQFA